MIGHGQPGRQQSGRFRQQVVILLGTGIDQGRHNAGGML